MKKIIACLISASFLLTTPVHTLANPLDYSQYTFYQKNNLAGPMEQKTALIAPFGQVRGGYNHQGIDVVAPMYTPIYAIADGVVTKASPDSKGVDKGGGHMIFIDHGDGTESWYMHLSTYAVASGDKVQAGDLIGLSGASGDVTGPHLHLEYRVNGVPQDPYFIFESFGLFEVSQVGDSKESEEETFLAKQE